MTAAWPAAPREIAEHHPDAFERAVVARAQVLEESERTMVVVMRVASAFTAHS